ncbi:hypothetical protein HF888_07390 [Bermanella marisrubri]|uniref:Lipoprotein n=1 Tax=Bermanella marisrubri TaxID=207949 RepID=Q1N4X7_9GAMM|nr:YajG family lipoprotein [Bermanella marisrubri]EAT13301.1 hypothetical protein RED65_01035 [Oceanobacter sp. RED65] [Bermanella marisrubri]QIZ84063.1 hypothetical protein HF888_07390 [Bermanella marisrubri]
MKVSDMIKIVSILSLVWVLAACTAPGPQSIDLSPSYEFAKLDGVKIPIELVIVDEREDTNIIGYRRARNDAPISLNVSLASTLGQSIQEAMQQQGIVMSKGPEPLTQVKVIVNEFRYWSPNEDWVSEVNLNATVTVEIKRGKTSLEKKFSAEKKQEVATAPNAKYNQKLADELLVNLIESIFSNNEIVNFLK